MSRPLGLALGFAADLLLGDPQRYHPVAGFGRTAGWLEERMYADSHARGTTYATVLVGVPTLAGWVLERRLRGRPVRHTAAVAAVTWAVLGGRSLRREARDVASAVAVDLPTGRRQVARIVGRDTSTLDEGGVVRACVETVAENTSDAVVTPLVWGAVLGVPGLVAHRAANTLDAMVGHRSARYARFGLASARLDDLLGLPGARLTAAGAVLAAPLVGGSSYAAWQVWRRDAAGHPSPNAGPVEASFAGALGVRMGGSNVYGDRIEHRHEMGPDRLALVADIGRTNRLSLAVSVISVVVAAGLGWVVDRCRDGNLAGNVVT